MAQYFVAGRKLVWGSNIHGALQVLALEILSLFPFCILLGAWGRLVTRVACGTHVTQVRRGSVSLPPSWLMDSKRTRVSRGWVSHESVWIALRRWLFHGQSGAAPCKRIPPEMLGLPTPDSFHFVARLTKVSNRNKDFKQNAGRKLSIFSASMSTEEMHQSIYSRRPICRGESMLIYGEYVCSQSGRYIAHLVSITGPDITKRPTRLQRESCRYALR